MKPYIISLFLVVLFVGCATPPPITFSDLKNAEELIICQGQEWERNYKGKELADYLASFQEDNQWLTLVIHSYKGEIKIYGHWYQINYAEIKQADRPASITIICEPKPLKIRQIKTNQAPSGNPAPPSSGGLSLNPVELQTHDPENKH